MTKFEAEGGLRGLEDSSSDEVIEDNDEVHTSFPTRQRTAYAVKNLLPLVRQSPMVSRGALVVATMTILSLLVQKNALGCHNSS